MRAGVLDAAMVEFAIAQQELSLAGWVSGRNFNTFNVIPIWHSLCMNCGQSLVVPVCVYVICNLALQRLV